MTTLNGNERFFGLRNDQQLESLDCPIDMTRHDTKGHDTTPYDMTRHDTTRKDTKIVGT